MHLLCRIPTLSPKRDDRLNNGVPPGVVNQCEMFVPSSALAQAVDVCVPRGSQRSPWVVPYGGRQPPGDAGAVAVDLNAVDLLS